jgi:hypothetical protein
LRRAARRLPASGRWSLSAKLPDCLTRLQAMVVPT